MAKAVRAMVTPEVLKWARNLDSISKNEAAKKMNIDVSRLEEWETGTSMPTLRQAKDLAKYYRIPFVYFYLPDTPQRKAKRIEKVDYRTFGNIGTIWDASRELNWLLRDIEERRDIILELYEKEKHEVIPFDNRLPINTDSEVIGEEIRKLLDITPNKQRRFRKPEEFLSYCVAKLEEMDFLIFQASKIDPSEMRGLSAAYETFPVVVLNRKDEPSARLFTLMHELVHILTNTSGICNDISNDSLTDNEIELKCNKIAGLVLVPKSEFIKHPDTATIKRYGLDDAYVSSIARDFAVSKEVVLHHLWDMGVISRKKYFEVLQRYSEEYQNYKAKKKKGFPAPAIDKGTQVGKLYARTVLNSYHGDKITARDASNYLLNLGPQHFERVERWCYR